MRKQAMFTMKLELDLRDQFVAEAKATDRPAAQVVREFMREFVQRQRNAREHDAWVRAEVVQGLAEAGDPASERIANEDVVAERREWRADLAKRAGQRPE